jgi:hypothetical protein
MFSLLFAGVVAGRWRRSRRPAFAAWAAGLMIFAAAAAVQAVGEARGFTPLTFRLFYLLGGDLGVAYLALGTLWLMASRRVALVTTAVLLALSAALTIDIFVVHVDAARLATSEGILGKAITDQGSPVQIAAVLLNIAGTLVLAGGSAWSAWRFARSHSGLDRVVCNVLLTAGALVIASGFSAAKTVTPQATMDHLGLVEAIGIAVMFAGFLALGRVPLRRPAAGLAPVGAGR